MAAILNLMPPDVRIVTVDDRRLIREGRKCPAAEPTCYLVHEIGSGDWYGYLWGRDVADFFALIGPTGRVASCLHADTLEEMAGILCSPPLKVAPAVFGRVGLVLFIHVVPGARGYRRRVASFWVPEGAGGHRILFRWNASSDTFEPTAELDEPAGLRRYEDFLTGLLDAGESETEAVRRRVVEFFGRET